MSGRAGEDGGIERLRRDSLGGIGSLHRLHWVIIGLSLLVTVSAWWVSRGLAAERIATRFDREATHLIELVTERMSRYEDALQAGVAAISARGGEIDRESWHAVAESLKITERYPGLRGIGVIRHVDTDGIAALVAREREDNPTYTVHPTVEADEHFVVVHLEPEADNMAAIGLDLAHETNRLEGARRARYTGLSRISAPIALVQDDDRTPGFLFFAPLNGVRANGEPTKTPVAGIDGLVVAPFIVDSLMEGVLASEHRQVWTSISDDGEMIRDEHDPTLAGYDPDPLHTRIVELSLYGRTWRFDIRSNLAFRESIAMRQPTIVLVGGLALDVMLIGLFLGLSRTNRALGRIADMNGDLKRKADALSETNRDLERFACVVSHDLKTPLRGIGDLAWYLEEDLAPYLASPDAAPEVAGHIERLHTQVRRMNGLIEGILDYSAAGDQAIRVEPVDSRTVFEEIAEGLELAERQLVLPDSMPVFETSRTRFEQVMNNIVGNAFKYHPEPDRAVVTVSVATLGEHYRFSIADNGAGIDPRFHEKIFEMFQTMQPKDAIESTGIGLSIVRKSLESVGGEVRVDSAPGDGAAFHVDWPIEIPGHAVAAPTASPHPSSGNRRRAA